MVCPLCGRNVPSSGQCSNCPGLRDKTVAGVLTPPPTGFTDHEATTYGLGDLAPTSSAPTAAAFAATPTPPPFPAAARSPDDTPTATPGSVPLVHTHSPDAPTRAPFPAAARSPDDTPTALPGSVPPVHPHSPDAPTRRSFQAA